MAELSHNHADAPEPHEERNAGSAIDNLDAQSTSSSSFSERHMYGPSSIRRSSTSRLSSTTLDRALSTIRSRAPTGRFTHPLDNEKTSPNTIVDFDGEDDPYRPLNWSTSKKLVTTILYGLTSMTATFASSVISPAIPQISAEFHIGSEVSLLSIALLLAGFGVGPLLWGPLSEVYGRKLAVLTPVFVAAMFAFGSGSAENVQTLMICRFFEGFFSSAPITNTGGVLGDIWAPDKRGAAMVLYSFSLIGGPTLGPIVGSAVVVTPTMGWRWCNYITGIFTLTVLFADILVLDESYPGALLVAKARRLRLESGNWALHAKHEEWNVSIMDLAHKYLVRPFQLLATPICLLMALYASFCYGLLYASLSAFPIVFEQVRGWGTVVGSLPFLAMLIGVLIGGCGNYLNQQFYIKRWKANDYHPVPEARLPPMMIGSILFAGGIFMFAWSGPPGVFWLVPCIGICLLGIGFFTIIQSALNYLVDTFQKTSASAIAANTFLRSSFATAFPLIMGPILHSIGVGWGLSIFGFISAILIPIPYAFYFYGERIRARGYWSQDSVYPKEKISAELKAEV